MRLLFGLLTDRRVASIDKLLVAAAVTYILTPVDLIPDFIPILGLLDDLLLVPLGLVIAYRMIPSDVMDECRREAAARLDQKRPTNWVAAGVIVAVWVVLAVLCVWLLVTLFV